MNQQDALKAIKAHHELGMAKHQPWTSPHPALHLMDLRLQHIANHTYKDGPNYDMDKAGRRALQLAGLCIRFVVDLDLEQGAPAPEG